MLATASMSEQGPRPVAVVILPGTGASPWSP